MTRVSRNTSHTLEDYLSRAYPFDVSVDEEGGYFILFPDLPGCMTQVDDISEISPMAEEIRTLWIETAYDMGLNIPPPSYPPTHSGKFNVRLPRSLHRALAESAHVEGVSLNQHVVAILSGGVTANSDIHKRLDRIESILAAIDSQLQRHSVADTSLAREGAHPS